MMKNGPSQAGRAADGPQAVRCQAFLPCDAILSCRFAFSPHNVEFL